MKKYLRVGVVLLILCMTLCLQVFASVPEDSETLEEMMEQFYKTYGVNQKYMTVSYLNLVTGEAYSYQDDQMMVAASLYKLPLNLYYYQKQLAGEMGENEVMSETGLPLSECHYQSLVWSNNEISISMLYHLGNFRTYKDCMRTFFTMTDDEINPTYYTNNLYCSRMMLDVLQYLYDHSEEYPEMLENMNQAQQDTYFCAYVRDYPVAHKYGDFEGAVNDAGIFYTEEPFILVVFTQDQGGEIVSRAAQWFTEYNVSHLQETQVEEPEEMEAPVEPVPGQKELEVEYIYPETEKVLEEQPEKFESTEDTTTAVETVQEEKSETTEDVSNRGAFEWWMLVVALLIFLLGGGGALFIFRPSRLQKKYPGILSEIDEEDEVEQ